MTAVHSRAMAHRTWTSMDDLGAPGGGFHSVGPKLILAPLFHEVFERKTKQNNKTEQQKRQTKQKRENKKTR
jgi:hypothetical protein